MRAAPHVVIRADANARIGLGHVSRCASLAEALRDFGARVTLLARTPTADVRQYVEQRGLDLHELTASDESDDAREVAAYLQANPCDALVVDHYELGVAWERALRETAPILLAIDDMGRPHDVDLLLDQNFGVDRGRPYDAHVPTTCAQLLGPQFALLPAVVANAARAGVTRNGQVARVLVFFGGADHTGEVAKALEALSAPEFAAWHVDVVTLATGVLGERVRALAESRPHTTLHGLRPHLVDLMLRADLAIGAGGTTTWERLALGLPSFVTLIAENQRQATTALVEAGAVHWVGDAATTTAESYRAALLAHDEPLAPPPPIVDAWGAKRVAARLLGDHVPFQARVQHGATAAVSVIVTRGGAPVGQLEFSADAALPMQMPMQMHGVCADDEGAVLRAAAVALAAERTAPPVWLCTGRPTSANQRRLVVLSDRDSWLNAWIPALVERWVRDGHAVHWSHSLAAAPNADLCFLLGWMQVVPAEQRARFSRVLVVHESALPRGRGMSPLTWQIIEGQNDIPISLLAAVDEVDAGEIYAQRILRFGGTELVDDLRRAQAEATLALCVEHVGQDIAGILQPRAQSGEPSHYPRRRPADSALDPLRTIAEQFDLLRVVDNDRYPAFFRWRHRTYVLRIQSDERNQT